VDFDRITEFVQTEARRSQESSVAPEDEGPEVKLERRRRLLAVIRLQEPAEQTAVLGYSEFRYTEILSPNDGTLAAFARSIGADYATFSAKYLGDADQIVSVPQQTNAVVTTSDGRWATGSATTMVPVQVSQSWFGYLVIYIRRLRPGESARAE